jgi:hypothetical protein
LQRLRARTPHRTPHRTVNAPAEPATPVHG